MAVDPFGVLTLLFIFAFAIYRLYAALVSRPKIRVKEFSPSTHSLAVFLGSGGHTSEALQLLSSLDFTRYKPRTYIVSEGDHLSAEKATELESAKASLSEDYNILVIPRARHVHQSLLSTPLSALNTLLTCTYYLTIEPLMFQKRSRMLTDILILNGPGTCTILCLTAFFNRFLGLHSPYIIYVESFARVRSLSLSGRLLRPFVDRFIVQWPQLLQDGKRGEYVGWLI